jgi:uncharacterized protein (DUF1697 family)
MNRYIALLRGINVGGNNKIDMKELKTGFEAQGFADVVTYINSGNIIFGSDSADVGKIRTACESLIFERFGLVIPTCVLLAAELLEAVQNAPDWWNTGEGIKHNAIFVLPPMTAAEACESMGEAKPEYEKIASHGSVIFWSAPLATFSRSRWSKVAGNKAVYNAVTIRNANTTCRLAEMVR